MNIEIQDPSRLINDGNSISTKAQDFQTEINTIYGIVDDLKNSWTGDSASRYTQNIESFKEDLVNLAKALEQFGELISAVGTDYQTLESEM